MRRDDHVGHGQEAGQQLVVQDVAGAVLEENVRFLLVNVEAGGTDPPRLDALQECLRVDQSAAGRVQDDNALLHPRDRVRVDHVPRLLRQRAVKRDDIAPLEQLLKRHIFDIAVLRRIGVIRDHIHAEPPADSEENPADLAGTDDPGRLTVQVKSGQPI